LWKMSEIGISDDEKNEEIFSLNGRHDTCTSSNNGP